MKSPRVWNVNDPQAPADGVLCDRTTPYGNPFIIGRDGTRAQVIERFRCEKLPSLDVSALRGRDLLCHCKPKPCHVDWIFRKANGPASPWRKRS